jgi:protein-disulfide isomerase
MHLRKPITRREFVQLLVVALVGWGIGALLKDVAPVGRDVGASPIARAMLEDEVSPSRTFGPPTLSVVVFTDYQCPACKLASPAFDAAVAKDAHIRVIYRDWPIFGPRSERAARVAIAAARQGIYPALHERLMAERRVIDEMVLREDLEAAGGNWATAQRDLRTHANDIDAQLERNSRNAASLKVAGTPAYLIGPLLVTGALDESGFAKVIAAARAHVR